MPRLADRAVCLPFACACARAGQPLPPSFSFSLQAQDQLRDHTGQKRRYWLVLKEIIRASPCFFLRVLAWY
jgi:hypothetical protein